MRKYNNKLIFDYITGNDIEDFTIDELEDSCEFMMEVIKYTKDKRIYDLCSDNVKNNSEFVKFMIETFKTDIKFVTSLTLSYFRNTNEDDITYKELVVLASSLKGDNDNLTTLKLKKTIFTTLELGSIEQALQECDSKVKSELGTGFIFIIDNYGNSEILKNYFAGKFVDKIFYRDDMTLEELIHKKFKDFQILKEQGINTFLINYIRNYDKFLADYITNHIELLSDLVKQTNKIGNNWDKYIENLNRRRMLILNQEVFSYIEENNIYLRFSVNDLIVYVMRQYNLEDIYVKYDNFTNFIDGVEIGVEELDDKKMNLDELKCYKFVSNLVNELFSNDIISQKSEEVPHKKYSGHSKILKFSANS